MFGFQKKTKKSESVYVALRRVDHEITWARRDGLKREEFIASVLEFLQKAPPDATIHVHESHIDARWERKATVTELPVGS